MRVSAAFSRLLDLPGIWVRKVAFREDVPDGVEFRRRSGDW